MAKLTEIFGIPTDLYFNQSDLDDKHYCLLKESLEPKAREFFKNEPGNAKRQGKEPRSYETVLKNTLDGFYAEYYLIQEYDFVLDPNIYRDLIHSSGALLEIKTFASEKQRLDTLKKIKNMKTKYPHVAMFFRNKTDYYLHSYYNYCKERDDYILVEHYGEYA